MESGGSAGTGTPGSRTAGGGPGGLSAHGARDTAGGRGARAALLALGTIAALVAIDTVRGPGGPDDLGPGGSPGSGGPGSGAGPPFDPGEAAVGATAEELAAMRAVWDPAILVRSSGEARAGVAPRQHHEFYIGAWCGPPARSIDAGSFERFHGAGLDLSVIPLEDHYQRRDNLARLALLDTLGEAAPPRPPPIHAFVRDDSVHWDETNRPGWRERIARSVVAYRSHPSFAGYFVADEPVAAHIEHLAAVTGALHDEDSTHPAYVNFGGPAETATSLDLARWRSFVARTIVAGRLQLFTVDRYAFHREGEDNSFLVSLANAAAVSRGLDVPFGFILQLTAHGPFVSPTPAMLRYEAMEAIAHGASGIIWFTYWSPNPAEEPHWRNGIVDYEGRPTFQYEAVRDVNAAARVLGFWLAGKPTLVAHLGGSLPPGVAAGSAVPGLRAASGGPISIGFTAELQTEPFLLRQLLVVNRDLIRHRAVDLEFDDSVLDMQAQQYSLPGSISSMAWTPGGKLHLELEPGEGRAVLLHLRDHRKPARDATDQKAGPIRK